jgi:antitoxin (DNA-binding transcriptional repressor) of toxin-antitoxin stability system
MKIASVADVEARLGAYLKEGESGPVIVTRDGKAVAVLLAITEDDELERLVLDHSPKFQATLDVPRIPIPSRKQAALGCIIDGWDTRVSTPLTG